MWQVRTFGPVVFVALWPVYNLLLVAFATASRFSVARRRRVEGAAPTGHEPAVFWIVVPCLNEERVVGQTVRNALGLQGPAGTRTRVLVVDDGSDDDTPGVLAAIDHCELRVLRRTLPDARKGKGEALNAAFRYIRAEVTAAGLDPTRVAVGVIDGDGRGSANMLVEVSRAMRDPDIGATQSRVRIHNRNRLLAAMQDLEFGCIVNASQLLRNSLGSVGLGGNGQFTRLSVLNMLGDAPWSACLVEDLELGLRIHLAGIRIHYLAHAAVTQQGLVDVRRLLRQRTRWAQGNVQCLRYIPRLCMAPTIRKPALVEMLYYILAPWINAVGAIVVGYLLGLSAVRYALTVHGNVLATAPIAVGSSLVPIVAPFLLWGLLHRLYLRDERLSRCLLAGMVYPVFLLLGLISTYRAIGRHFAGRQTWAKTERLADEPIVAVAARPAELLGSS
jgi:1,2-diacylglycerol 3-beta-glucosyltransferase